MIVFIVHLTVPESNRAAFEALVSRVRDDSLREEPGVLAYQFAIQAGQPDTYVVIETYRDAAAHAGHMATSWVRDSMPRMQALVSGAPRIRQYVGPGTEPAVRLYEEAAT